MRMYDLILSYTSEDTNGVVRVTDADLAGSGSYEITGSAWDPDSGIVTAANPDDAKRPTLTLQAPNGAAAIEVLKKLGAFERVESRIVQGENIAQAHQFVATGNAQLGFVALSQVYKDGKLASGSMWLVPADFYSPILQDAVLLAKGRDKPAAAALLAYLKGDKARAVIRSYGYELR